MMEATANTLAIARILEPYVAELVLATPSWCGRRPCGFTAPKQPKRGKGVT